MVHSDKEVAAKLKKTIVLEVSKPIAYTSDEALGLYVDSGFSKNSYKLMQTGANIGNANIYPSYETLLLAKKKNVILLESKLLIGLQKCLCRPLLTIL